ncbi:uncharacterized protein LOC134216650 [Armigeres subalbatus]|uniref:uncharacterized protein LOC134216650 n=1 Tax=Armigeres subalbatus TaxID=124917 RepID=UPI002ED23779
MSTKYHTRRQKWTTSRDFLRLMSDQLDDGIHTSKQKSCGENPHFSSMVDSRSNGRRQGPVVKFSKQRSSSVVLEPVRVRPWQHLCKPHQYRPDAPSLWSRPQPESAANCEGHSCKPFKSEHYHPATSSKQAVQVQSVGQKVSVATVSTSYKLRSRHLLPLVDKSCWGRPVSDGSFRCQCHNRPTNDRSFML